MKHILITGGAGYIGSHTNKMLNKKGFETVVVDNLSSGYEDFVKWGVLEKGNIGNKDFLSRIMQKYAIDTVMHFSAFAYVGESYKNPQKYYKNNVIETLNLLEVMLECDIRRFIFSSSCAVYGLPKNVPITEDEKKEPINPYGWTKLIIESALKAYSRAYGLRYISLRYFNAAGADEECETGELHIPETHLIPRVLDVALGRRPYIEIYGNDYNTSDGTCIRDYIHVTDLAEAHIKALLYLNKYNKSEVFNIGNERGFSVLEIINVVEKITGKKIEYKISSRREGDPDILIASSKKAREVLRWTPYYEDIYRIIETAWQWHKKISLKKSL